jgi:hypothetical protein
MVNANPTVRRVELGDGFTMQITGAEGFCPVVGALLSAVVARDGAEIWTLSGTTLMEGDPATDRCYESHPYDLPDCLVETPIQSSVLTAAQITELKELLDQVPPEGCQQTGPSATDPCRVAHFDFGGREEDTDCFSGGNSEQYRESLESLWAFLELVVSETCSYWPCPRRAPGT